MRNRKFIIFSIVILTFLFVIFFINLPQVLKDLHFQRPEPGSPIDTLFALILAIVVLIIGIGLGSVVTKPLKLESWTFEERLVIYLPVGLALIGYGEFFLGLLGFIKPIHQIFYLLFLSLLCLKLSFSFLEESISNLQRIKTFWTNLRAFPKFIIIVGIFTLFLAFLITLTPPWDYDSLMYHLQGPRIFLEIEKIVPYPENWFTFYPSTWEMIYMLGLGLGFDVFAKLIHFATLLLLIFSTFVFGKRLLSKRIGLIASAILVGNHMMIIWGTFAYTDLAWSVFQFTAVAVLLLGIKEKNDKYIILSGILQGFALGSKYLAFSGLLVLNLYLVMVMLKNLKEIFKIKKAIKSNFMFSCAALLIASPWYLKNLLWTGNPAYFT